MSGNANIQYRPRVDTFERFLLVGQAQSGASVVDGVPWSFTYNGCPVTHEHDELYLITQGSRTLRFGFGDLLVTMPDGTLVVLPQGQVPEDGGWFLPKQAVTDGVQDKLNELIHRAKWGGDCDVKLRAHGEDVTFEADWVKYMVPVAAAPVSAESQSWVTRLGAVVAKFQEPSVINRVSVTKQDEIIKRLMTNLGQPDSRSLYEAFKQFANEICQGHESLVSIVQRVANQSQPAPDVMTPVDHDLKGTPIHSDLAKSIAARPVPIPGINAREPLTEHQQQQVEAGRFN